MSIDYIILTGAILILVSILIAKLSERYGIPALILFLALGMIAGSEGIGGIYFDDAYMAQAIGVIALVIILFAGGLETKVESVRPVVRQALGLATLGVLLTALSVGLFVYYVFHLPFLHSLLIGAIISSTDAAAVFSVLRSKEVGLKGRLQPLLELESGSNDPMAVFLTIGIIQLITTADASIWSILKLFITQMGIGTISGFLAGKAMIKLIKLLNISQDGIYSVFSLAFAFLVYSITALLYGSGFLAVYITGIVLGGGEFIQKKSMLRFFDGFAWLSQIVMFLTLGLLVFPSQVIKVTGTGLVLALFLMFVARPISVYLTLAFSKLDWRAKAFISWVGLRGAVPIILATFPLIAGVPNAPLFFSLIFFIVLTSALLQGWSLTFAARILKVDAPSETKPVYPIELSGMEGMNTDLIDIFIHYRSSVAGKSIAELSLPDNTLITMINREGNYLVPQGSTVIKAGDILLILSGKESLRRIREIFK